MGDSTLGLIVGMVVAGCFANFNIDYISQEEYKLSEQLCADNKGLQRVGSSWFIYYHVICVNGAKFDYKLEDLRKRK